MHKGPNGSGAQLGRQVQAKEAPSVTGVNTAKNSIGRRGRASKRGASQQSPESISSPREQG